MATSRRGTREKSTEVLRLGDRREAMKPTSKPLHRNDQARSCIDNGRRGTLFGIWSLEARCMGANPDKEPGMFGDPLDLNPFCYVRTCRHSLR